MKKQILYPFLASAYIVILVLGANFTSRLVPEPNLLIPIFMLGLFVLSAAIMGFLFLSEPAFLYAENRKTEAVSFFLKTLGIFAGFMAFFLVAGLILSKLW